MARGLFVDGTGARQAVFLVAEPVATLPVAWDGDVTGEGVRAPL